MYVFDSDAIYTVRLVLLKMKLVTPFVIFVNFCTQSEASKITLYFQLAERSVLNAASLMDTWKEASDRMVSCGVFAIVILICRNN